MKLTGRVAVGESATEERALARLVTTSLGEAETPRSFNVLLLLHRRGFAWN